MKSKLRYTLEFLAGGVVVILGVLLTAKAVPQAVASYMAENSQRPTPEMPVERPSGNRLMPGWRGRMGGMAQPERHFIVMMIPHHDDAIAMADLALTRARHPEIKILAQRIKQTQTQENQQMRTWYREWFGESVPDWQAGMGMGQGMMARRGLGMGGCMRSDLESLKTAPDFDRAFLEEMVPHHQMGVRMAEMVLVRSDRPEIKTLANAIIRSQSAEIDQMQDWYRDWYPEGVQ